MPFVDIAPHDNLYGPRSLLPPVAIRSSFMPLSSSQKRYLRGFTHALKPVVMVGQKGVTAALLDELDGALSHHELVKVKLTGADRESRTTAIETMRTRTNAELVQTIGHVACFYRRNPDQSAFALPK